MRTPPVVTAPEWEAARERLLAKEKEVTRARDALAAQRRLVALARRVPRRLTVAGCRIKSTSRTGASAAWLAG